MFQSTRKRQTCNDEPIIACGSRKVKEIVFVKILKQYNIKKCYYGHLHGKSHQDAVEGIVDGIEFKLISADYLNFDLIKVT